MEPGVFETLKVTDGRFLWLKPHLERLATSLRSTAPSVSLNLRRIHAELQGALREKGLREAYVRFTLVCRPKGKTLSFVILKSPKQISPALFHRGVSVETSATRRNSLAALSGELKVREFQNGLLCILEGLGRPEIFERIYLDTQGYVCEGTIANLFLLKGDELVTPPSYLGVLSGVTRSAVLAVGRRQGLRVAQRPFTRFELYNAEEVFLTNTSFGILPVVKADGRPIGDGKVGSWTGRLRKAYQEESVRSDE